MTRSDYMLRDFSSRAHLGTKQTANTWPVAMHLAISIYLDVVNLFLELLDLIS